MLLALFRLRRPTLLAVPALLAPLVALPGTLFADASWPEWRGPEGDGHAPESVVGLPIHWSETENVRWKTPIAGRGYSTPVVSGGEIWMTTAHEVEETDPAALEERLRLNTGSQPLTLLKELRLHAVCVDLETGELLADIELIQHRDPQWVHKLNSYASPSPVIRDGRLYCHFGAFGTACVDTAKREVLWTNTDLAVMHENGPGSSPVLWRDRLILHLDGSDQQFVAALDTASGEVAWRTERSGELRENPQMRKAYGTPLLVEIGGEPVVISTGADWLYGYDPATGQELWRWSYGLLGFSNVARPVAANGLLYFTTGFMKAEMIGMALGKRADEPPRELWRFRKAVPKMPSPILVGDHLYMVSDNGVAACLDAETGEAHWQERLEGEFSASPIFADGKLYFFSRDGTTSVLQPGVEMKVLAENKVAGSLMASGVPIHGGLLLRTDAALYRIESGKR